LLAVWSSQATRMLMLVAGVACMVSVLSEMGLDRQGPGAGGHGPAPCRVWGEVRARPVPTTGDVRGSG
jgi:hypothetical protein